MEEPPHPITTPLLLGVHLLSADELSGVHTYVSRKQTHSAEPTIRSKP